MANPKFQAEIKSDCYHCVISQIAQLAIQTGRAEFKQLVADLMQTAAEIIESRDPGERAELAAFALERFEQCRKDARETFDQGGGINQPAMGHA